MDIKTIRSKLEKLNNEADSLVKNYGNLIKPTDRQSDRCAKKLHKIAIMVVTYQDILEKRGANK